MAGAVSRDPAAGGHVEIVRSRIQQGDLVAIAAGTLSLNTNGRIDGELQMTVAGIEKVIPALGIEKCWRRACRRQPSIAWRRA